MIYLHVYKIDKDIKVKSKQLLKSNLAHYLEIEDVTINHNENGKPMTSGIQFSISHCKNTLIQAFSFNGELGVDIEYINKERNYLRLAERYFHTEEYKLLTAVECNESALLFYKLWTAKEAVCKAQGGRLWFYLKDNYLCNKKIICNEIKGLQLKRLNTFEDYSLTLATETLDNRVILIHA